jgi:branched-chain amino acid transport system ATP-binding protein
MSMSAYEVTIPTMLRGLGVLDHYLDEASKLTLAPNIVDRVFDVIKGLQAQGSTIMMVEQNAFAALELSDRSYVIEQGRLTLTGTGKALLKNPQVKAAYLGA